MKTKKRLIIIFLIGLLIINTSYAETYTAFTNIVGVDNKGRGIVGNVTVEIQPGKGRVLVDTTPLQGIYTQNSERTAVQVTEEITGFDFSDYDVIYSIMTPGAHVVDGPSAGGAMTLVTIAAIEGRDISPAFAMTGTIQEDGSIGPVGEILAKAKAASDFGVTVFLIPEGQAVQNQYVRKVKTPAPGWYIETIEPVPVNIIEYAKENWGLTVYEVSDIKEVMKYAFGEIPSPRKKATKPLEEISLPRFTSPVQDYNDFSSLIEDEISRAKNAYQKTNQRLGLADLSPDIKHDLTSTMKKSKQYLDEAEEIKEKGYLYSAGNDAFKSLINSNTVDDLIDYYSKSEIGRFTYLQDELTKIKKELSKTKQELISKTEGSICDRDDFEWAVAARQRITYAENRINSIQLTQTDQVGIFFDINTAREWIQISKNFMSKTRSSGNSSCVVNFKDEAEKTLTEAEHEVSLTKSLGLSVEDAEWYLQASKKEFSEGWYISTIYDAISAKTRANVASKYEGKSINELYEIFNEKNFTTQNLLGTIFLEHSHFMMYKAVKDDSESDALQAIQLVMVSKNINENYGRIKKQLVKTPFSWSINVELSSDEYVIVLVVMVVCLGLYTLNLRSRIRKLEERYKTKSKRMRLKKVQEEIKTSLEEELKKRLKKKEITKKEYEELKRKLLK